MTVFFFRTCIIHSLNRRRSALINWQVLTENAEVFHSIVNRTKSTRSRIVRCEIYQVKYECINFDYNPKEIVQFFFSIYLCDVCI